tara:strand:- start:280 stop:393 length:114 start_codon:yes stop_codon:yes gene_type:complete
MTETIGNVIFWGIVTSPIWLSILFALILAYGHWGDDK